MSALQLRPVSLGIITLLVAAVIIVVETVVQGSNNGTFLLTLSFWVALIEGPVALVAAADISRGKWIKPLRRDLISFYPLILFTAVLFIFMSFHLEIYPWIHESHSWLSPGFFIWRNVILLIIGFLLAHFYVRASLSGKAYTGKLAVLFILSFIITQSLVAFDWVMSLAYPWMSTMFAPIFFMESFYAGLTIAALISVYLLGRQKGDKSDLLKVLRDSAVFMFGFALAWAGLYYGQYLVVWYGNIPWETSFFAVRMSHSPYHEMLYITIFMLFIIPFVALLPSKVKTSRIWVFLISIIILAGLLIERIFYILPVLPVNYFWLVVEFVLIGFLMVLFFLNREVILPASDR